MLKMSEVRKGDVFGRWVVADPPVRGSRAEGTKPRAMCVCLCGTSRVVALRSLLKGLSKSCGCISSEVTARRNRKHGMSKSPEYLVWEAMRARCRDVGDPDYGGRGITVCREWEDFSAFLRDMGKRPEGLTLERLDNSKGYGPDNCVWAPRADQNRNKRNNVVIDYQGVSQTVADWAKELGLHPQTLYSRVHRGLTPEMCLSKERLKC